MKFFRYILLALAGVCMASCSSDSDDEVAPLPPPTPGEGLTLSLSKAVIQANGADASEFIVNFDGQRVTEGVTIYDGNDKPLASSKEFKTTQEGEYKFWATYKTHHSKTVVLKAISEAVPVLPEDRTPEKTSFEKKVFFTQFTGNKCPNCPRLTILIREVMAEQAYADKVVMSAAHTYNSSDPGYLENDRIEQAFGITAYPSMMIDCYKGYIYNFNTSAQSIRKLIDEAYQVPAYAGITAKSELIEGKDGHKKIALHVAVKAAEDGEYCVGAWLMEDSIKARQANAGIPGDYDTHNNVVRIADSKSASMKYNGIKLGEIEKGKTAEHVFVMDVKDKWLIQNCHIAIFVTKATDGRFPVVNAVSCPVEGALEYNYTK